MSRPSTSVAALVMRALVLLFGGGLFVEQARYGALGDPAHGFTLLAPAFFLWGLWAASSVFVRIGWGAPFGPSVVRGLNEMGAALMLGAFAAVVVQPVMAFLIGNGFLGLKGIRLGWSVETVTLAMVGLVLVLIAKEGGRLRASLEQFV